MLPPPLLGIASTMRAPSGNGGRATCRRRAGRRSAGVLLALALACSPAAPAADAWIDPGHAGIRHDLQLLIDYGVLPHANAGSWPLPRDVLREVNAVRLQEGPAMVRDAWQRVSTRLSPDARQDQQLRTGATAGGAERLRPFHASPRERGELEFRFWERRRFWTWRLNVIAAGAPQDDRQIRLDGSHITLDVGEWLLTAGALNRWWGPGHDGSLVLGTNARPVPGLSLQRATHRPFDTRWLAWLGSWDFTASLSRTDGKGPVPHWYLFGARATLRPLPGLEVGLLRSAQWGGEGRPRTLRNFYDVVTGSSDTPANQYAGFDVRYRLPGETRLALYGQLVGVDETRLVPRDTIGLVGLETWGGQPGAGLSWRLHVEYSDTLVDFHRRSVGSDNPRHEPAYLHQGYPGGYRYLDRTLGHAIDNDSRMLSTGALLVHRDRDMLRTRAWYADINRTERNQNGIGPPRAERGGVDFSWGRQHGTWNVEIGTGVIRSDTLEDGASWSARGYLNVTRPL